MFLYQKFTDYAQHITKVEIFLRTVSSIDLISLKIQISGGKKKNGKKFDPPPLGFESLIFEKNFLAQDLNFEGD